MPAQYRMPMVVRVGGGMWLVRMKFCSSFAIGVAAGIFSPMCNPYV